MCHRCPIEVPPPVGSHLECPWCGAPFDNFHQCGGHTILVVANDDEDVPLRPIRWARLLWPLLYFGTIAAGIILFSQPHQP